jgi:hypothetical protein
MKGWMDSYDFNSHDRFLPIILIGTQGRCNHRTTRQLAVSANCMCVCSNCSRHEHAVAVKSNPPCQACCGPKTVSDHIMFGCPVARALWSAIGVTLHPDTLVRPHDDELSAVQPPRPDPTYVMGKSWCAPLKIRHHIMHNLIVIEEEEPRWCWAARGGRRQALAGPGTRAPGSGTPVPPAGSTSDETNIHMMKWF